MALTFTVMNQVQAGVQPALRTLGKFATQIDPGGTGPLAVVAGHETTFPPEFMLEALAVKAVGGLRMSVLTVALPFGVRLV